MNTFLIILFGLVLVAGIQGRLTLGQAFGIIALGQIIRIMWS